MRRTLPKRTLAPYHCVVKVDAPYLRAPWAANDVTHGARQHAEPADPLRASFQLDRHRIIECTAFRRLERKTQAFAPALHDHFRTRLTHTLEVAQIARTLARSLGANEDLTEAITLAHDLGHPPFGHAGEATLNEALATNGGFNHNAHSVRVVTYLEHPFPAFRGLNLTLDTLDGLRAHATRYDRPEKGNDAGPSVEAQIASVADRVAYDCHDLEDAIGAELVTSDELAEVALWWSAYDRAVQKERTWSRAPIYAVRRIVLDTVLNDLLIDVVGVSIPLLSSITSFGMVKEARLPLVVLSKSADAALSELERFLLEHVYRHPTVVQADADGRRMILALFDAYRHDPQNTLPPRFAARIAEQGVERVVCDYIAGMTDRFCMREHARLVV